MSKWEPVRDDEPTMGCLLALVILVIIIMLMARAAA